MLVLKNISLKKGSKIILDKVSCQFHPGKLNLILGPNGAGKSSILKVCTGQTRPDVGEVLFEKKIIGEISIRQLAKMRAVLSQETEVAFHVTVNEIVMMGRYCHFAGRPDKADLEACAKSMELFSVLEFKDRYYHTLSGGEKQRVLFAKAFAQVWPDKQNTLRYLFLDEPLTFLDLQHQLDFIRSLKILLQDPCLLVVGVVHDLNLAAGYADHVILLRDGKIYAEGNTWEVLTVSNIEAVFGIKASIHEGPERRHLLF